MAEMLGKNNTLQKIEITGSKIQISSAKLLIEALAKNKAILSLALNIDCKTNPKPFSGEFSDEGIIALAEMLKNNNTLQELDLHGINLSDKGVSALTAMLKKIRI